MILKMYRDYIKHMQAEKDGGLIYYANKGKIQEHYNTLIYQVFIACKGNIELIEEIFTFRQLEDSKYYVNGIGQVIRVWRDTQGLERWKLVNLDSRGKNDYLRIKDYTRNLKIDGAYQKQINVHNAIARCFLYKTDESDDQVNHINKIRTDNKVWNLEWCNNKKNNEHRAFFYNELEKDENDNKPLCIYFNVANFVRERDFKGKLKKIIIDKELCYIEKSSKGKFKYTKLFKEILKVYNEYLNRLDIANLL